MGLKGGFYKYNDLCDVVCVFVRFCVSRHTFTFHSSVIEEIVLLTTEALRQHASTPFDINKALSAPTNLCKIQ